MSSTARRVREVLVSRLADWYGVAPEEVTDDRPFAEYGLTSRDSVVLTALLGRATGRQLPATLLWETPTPAALIAALTAEEEEERPAADGITARPEDGRPGPATAPGRPPAGGSTGGPST
ncbi:acyl carrier protein [Streptomyces sp. MJP52]|uniref:acyl carrier protein n=1 Tax=Streptomyces sp. MJP52 TaxID=2940555 RepID=UPI002475CE6E|nr:acyl carrier protein [Streptomyces sp. MJP52]MDH6224499.1 acyl carrier protein [Streptomyces sp. MJP52]